MGYTKDQLLALLQESQIKFLCYNHPVVLTIEAQAKYVGHLGGGLSKNLFLKDKKHRFYVISALATTKVDLKVLSQRLGLGKGGLRMAPEEALQEILQVPLGCVTPFSLINESARGVSLLLDQGFKAQECCFFHPLSNDVTLSLGASDLDKFLALIRMTPSYVDLEATPVVGKDNPPDLAGLVPSEVVIFSDQEKIVPSAQLPTINRVPVEEQPTNFAETKTGTERQKVTIGKPENTSSGPLVDSTDVGKFVEELIEKASAAVLLEINKQSDDQQRELGSSVLSGVRKRITADLEDLTMGMKNAAYTQGFHSGVQAMLHSGLKCMPFRDQKYFL